MVLGSFLRILSLRRESPGLVTGVGTLTQEGIDLGDQGKGGRSVG